MGCRRANQQQLIQEIGREKRLIVSDSYETVSVVLRRSAKKSDKHKQLEKTINELNELHEQQYISCSIQSGEK